MVSRKLLVGGDEFCLHLIYFLPVDTFIPGLPPNHIGILMVFAGILNVVNSLITVLWIKSKEREAQDEGGEEAAKSVIFPVFVQVVWINIAINLYAGLVEALTPFDPEGANVLYVSIIYSLVYALRHLVTEGLAFLLMQKGCGKHAAYEAGRQAIVWGIITYIFTFVSLNDAGILGKTFAVFLDFIVCLFYLILWIAPLKHLYRRPSAIFYSRFWAIYRFCAVIVNLFSFFQDTNDLSACGYIFVNLVLFAIIQPIFCYWTLLLDSRWWQGIEIFDQRRVRTESYENIRAPLIGSDFSLATAQSLADTMDRIRVQGQVKMLNFACIKIDFQQHLGAGSFSKVYRGKYRGKECAIKLIYTVDLTTDIIQRVAAEASILSSIRHPNIVNILGVSVLPPSVCLLLELCEFGSLSDIIRGYGFDWNTSHRSPLQLNRLDILHLALGCAKGLSAVHSYDKSICHRDVKSFNFLVDSQFTVKIADLELGVLRSREGLRDPVTAPTHNHPEPLTLSRSAKGPHDELMSAFSDPNYVQVEELLANWMAPDVIEHRRFQQASDVFSLGTVLWEIVSKELPFDGETQPEIRRKLLAGYKHPLPTTVQGTPLGIVIERCWERDPSHRPQASEIVEILENLLKQSFIDIIQENSPHHHTIQYIPNFMTLHDFYEAAYRKSNNFIHAGTTATSSSRRSGGTGGIMKGLYRFIVKNNPVSWLFSSQDSGAAGDASVDMFDEGREDSFLLNNTAAGDATTRTSEYGNNTTTTGGTGGGNVTFQTLDTSVSVSNRSIFNFSFGRNTNNNNDNDSDHHEREESQYILPNYLSKKNMLNIIMPPAALDAIKLIKQEKYWYELESSNESWAIFTNTYPFILIHATSSWYELFNVPSSFGIDFQLLSLISLLYPEIEAMEQQSSSSNTYVMTLAQKSMFRDLRRNTSKEIISQLKKQYEDVHGILCLHLPYMSRHSRHRSGGSGHHSKGSKGLKGNVRGGGTYNASMDFRDSFDPLGVIGGEGDEEKGGEKDKDEDDDEDDLPMPTFSIDTSGRISGHNMMCSIHAYPVYPPEEAVNVDNLVASTTRHSMQDTSTPGKMPGTPSRSIADRGSATYSPINLGGKDRPSSSRKSLGFNERLSAQDNKVAPMYFAILFNELREQDHPRPGNNNNNDGSQSSSGSQYQQNRNMYQYHSTGSRKISDITASSAFIDLTSDKDENEGKGGKKKEGENEEEDQNVMLQRYYSNEFDEIYDRELDSNATNLSESYGRRGDQSFWNNFLLPRFWTHINAKDDERRSTNSRLARLPNKKGNDKSKGGGGDGNARRMNSIA